MSAQVEQQTKHAPAPWALDEDEDLSGMSSIEIFHEGAPIASVYGSDEFPCTDSDTEDEVAAQVIATARLIAASPDLLAACHAALEMRARLGEASNTLGIWSERIAAANRANELSDQIRAAIARAEGQA
jgi:hypothetical protein